MCGITGMLGREDIELVRDMTHLLEHRGPDNHGYFNDKDISLGHRRLSIIDLSERGKQPLFNENRDICVICNGEIYNFLKLRKDLEDKGHKFYSNSDSEVLVHLYEEYGEGFISKLNGMFAFCLWDNKNKKGLVVRDRLGIKPLYYYFKNGVLIFSSEIKSLLLDESISKELDLQALSYFLSLRFIPGPRTIIKDIKKLQSGHYIRYENKYIEIKKYWDFSFGEEKDNINKLSKELYELLEDSVEKRLVSDVPVGIFLSGGIDSSTIVQIASKLKGESISTFSVGFGNEKDLENAKFVANKFNTEHTEIIIEPNSIELLPKIVWSFDEPMADPAAIPTYVLSEQAKKKATVCLVGEGADEIFGGYEQYKIMKLGKVVSKFPSVFRKTAPFFARKMPKSLMNKFFKYSESLGEKGIERFGKFLKNLNDDTISYLNLVTLFDKDDLNEFGNEEISKYYSELEDEFRFYFNSNSSLLNRTLNCEIRTEMVDTLLIKVDKMTMAHAVEARVPFLDYRIVEFMSKVKSNLKLNGLKDKYLLRKTMINKLPKQIVNAKKERFFVPIDDWIHKDLRELTNQVLNNSVLLKKGLVKKEYFEKIMGGRDKSKLYYARQMWNILNFELWYRIFIDNKKINKSNLRLSYLL